MIDDQATPLHPLEQADILPKIWTEPEVEVMSLGSASKTDV
jgi:hypothetical protein